ncbi:ketopantoate hydroxymethyltransferase-domain-containing protein [Sparassis latifolia]
MRVLLGLCSSRLPCHPTTRFLSRRWMSVRPEENPGAAPRRKVTIEHLHKLRRAGTPITMLTAYDFPTARACDAHGVDITLVGDSLAQVCLGLPSTTRLTLPEMVHHTRAVARGTTAPLLVADMPFGTYHASPADAVRSAVRLVRDGRAEAVKLEGGSEVVPAVRALTAAGIPVMAHVGLLPQRHAMLSGYRVQGRDAPAAHALLRAALALEDAGAFAVVLEAVPHPLAAYITRRLRRAPTIGIGAGAETDGQVLVWDDVMGTWAGHQAKFVRRFADVAGAVEGGVKSYLQAVRERTFPVAAESYEMAEGELEKFMRLVEEEAPPSSGVGETDS